MLTPDEMRQLARECLSDADETRNLDHRDLLLRIAKTWIATAAAIEQKRPQPEARRAPALRVLRGGQA